jgi:hypothetical protein
MIDVEHRSYRYHLRTDHQDHRSALSSGAAAAPATLKGRAIIEERLVLLYMMFAKNANLWQPILPWTDWLSVFGRCRAEQRNSTVFYENTSVLFVLHWNLQSEEF